MRGKDASVMLILSKEAGSPPRAREGHIGEIKGAKVAGITPACAGRTIADTTPCCRLEDHPRVRGKDVATRLKEAGELGSPPRAREGHTRELCDRTFYRITPACAGRTAWDTKREMFTKDHPRVRGKDYSIAFDLCCRLGSPPRAREGPAASIAFAAAAGITPACAGRTKIDSLKKLGTKDHPRVRGKDVLYLVICFIIKGSPPRARG